MLGDIVFRLFAGEKKLKKLMKVLLALVALLVLSGGGSLMWANSAAAARLSATYETHRVDFPIPFLLTEGEIEALRAEKMKGLAADVPSDGDVLAGVDLTAIARERAIARGKHLVEARYACIECHGNDYGGGTMIDAPPIGHLFGVNLTSGKGGQVANFTASDWDRIVRHGVRPNGQPSPMPSVDFASMSDQELSDIVTFIQSRPPVDREMPRAKLGPLGAFLVATKEIVLTAENLDHQKHHLKTPPLENDVLGFGQHLVQVCTGCHRTDLSGGPIAGGDPSWAPAANLTPHGLSGWTYDDFVKALKEAKSKDGRALRSPMSAMTTYAANISESEMKAMWAYLQTVPKKEQPGK